MASILSIGSYLPKYRMQRQVIADQLAWFDRTLNSQAKGARSVANWDEDAITLAVAAAQQSIESIDLEISNLVFASTSAPFMDRSNATLIAEALSLQEQTSVMDSAGSQRAATSALLNALKASSQSTTLITAADRRQAAPGGASEMRYGDAAAAIVVGPQEGLASYLGGASIAQDFVDHYRTAERPNDYSLEDRWVRDVGVSQLVPQAINLALQNAGREPSAIDHLVLPLPLHHAKAVLKKTGLDASVLADNLFAEVGDSGVGHGLLMLNQVLATAQPGQLVCLVGFGQGCDVLLFEVTKNNEISPSALTDQLERTEFLQDYLKLPVFSRQVKLAAGIRAEADKRTSISAYHRNRSAINAMLGSVCGACKTPHYPPARVCVSCHTVDDMSDYSFADKIGSIKSFTEDWQTATPSPPMSYANVEFEGGGNAFLELSDVVPGSITVGSQLKMQFRIKDYDDTRGFRRYFWKPVPLDNTKEGDDNG